MRRKRMHPGFGSGESETPDSLQVDFSRGVAVCGPKAVDQLVDGSFQGSKVFARGAGFLPRRNEQMHAFFDEGTNGFDLFVGLCGTVFPNGYTIFDGHCCRLVYGNPHTSMLGVVTQGNGD